LGLELGAARAIGAVLFSVAVGLAMHWVFRREEQARAEAAADLPVPEARRPLWQTVLFFGAMVGVLVFANWSKPAQSTGLWAAIYLWKWPVTGLFAAGLAGALGLWFGFNWRELGLAGALVLILSLAFPREPLIPFVAGCAGLAVLCGRHPARGGNGSRQAGR
jgi:cbb3-type cytochrome oxidase subunit 3